MPRLFLWCVLGFVVLVNSGAEIFGLQKVLTLVITPTLFCWAIILGARSPALIGLLGPYLVFVCFFMVHGILLGLEQHHVDTLEKLVAGFMGYTIGLVVTNINDGPTK